MNGEEGRVDLFWLPLGADSGCGVVGAGPVGSRLLRPLRPFRYELHAIAGGAIPDLDYAVESPRRVGRDEADAHRVPALLPSVPLFTWGRDELRPPRHGRAPGWRAGIEAAHLSFPAVRPAAGLTRDRLVS